MINDTIPSTNNSKDSFETYYHEALKEKAKENYIKSIDFLRAALRYKPQNAEVQYELSISYKLLKKYPQAILYGENAVAFKPTQKWYWLNIAEVYSIVGNNKSAERCYAKASELDSDFLPQYVRSIARSGNISLALSKVDVLLKNKETEELLAMKRDLLIVNNQNEKAIDISKKLIDTNPKNITYYFNISDLLIQENKIDLAEEYVIAGLKIDSENNTLTRQEFKILILKSDFDGAFGILNSVLNNNKFNFNDKIGFVIEFVKNDVEHKETLRLIESLKTWANDSHEVKIYPIIGNLYKSIDNKTEALASFRKGYKKGHTDFSGLIDMLILEQELSKFNLLAEDTQNILKLYPSQPILFLFNGLALNQIGEFESSITSLDKGVKLVVNNDKLKSEFHSLMADSYYRENKLEQCFYEFEKALKYDAENNVVLNNYSYYLSENNLQLDKALKMIKQVIEEEPTNSTYLDTMAWIYFKQKDYTNAQSTLKIALKNGGDKNADILEHYGDTLFKLNKTRKAVRQWKKALKLNSSSSTLKNKINKKAI